MSKRKFTRAADILKASLRPDQAGFVDEVVSWERRDAIDRARMAREGRQRREAEERELQDRKRQDQELRERVEADQRERNGPVKLANRDEHGHIVGGIIWESEQAHRTFEVADGPTISRSRNGRVVIRRGCMLCGSREVVPGLKAFDGLPASGYTCKPCQKCLDRRFDQIGQRLDLARNLQGAGATQTPNLDHVAIALTDRLRDVRPDIAPEGVEVVEDWTSYVWAVRVLDSDTPAAQQPPGEPFGFLVAPTAATLSDYSRGANSARVP